MSSLVPKPTSLSDADNSACDLVLPHPDLSPDDEQFGKFLRENFEEIRNYLLYARQNECFGGSGKTELTFSYPAGLIVSTSLKGSLPPETVVTGAIGHLKTAGSTPTTVEIYHANSLVANLQFSAGSVFASTSFTVTTGARSTSLWHLSIATAGTGAVGLVVHLTTE